MRCVREKDTWSVKGFFFSSDMHVNLRIGMNDFFLTYLKESLLWEGKSFPFSFEPAEEYSILIFFALLSLTIH